MTLPRRLVGEGLGTALLLVAVVGSGIMAERLAGLGQIWAEFIATFGLLAIVLSCVASASRAVPCALAAFITGAY
jgi:glycerol uptake facilitator-like aquaporin